jgi:hypothetical protein
MKEYRLSMFENRMLTRIFGPKKQKWQEAGEDCMIKRLHNLYASPNIIREDEMGEACTMHGRDEKCIFWF